MRATKVMGAEPGSVPIFQLYGASSKADVYKITVSTVGPSGTAKITITSQGSDDVAAAVVTHATPFLLGTSGVSVVMFFDYLRLNDTWDIRTRATGEVDEPSPLYNNFPGTVRPSQVGEGLGIQQASKPALAVIAAGAALSNEIDGRGYSHLWIQMPAAWTTADIALHTSERRGGTFSLLRDKAAAALLIDGAAVDDSFVGIDFLKGVAFFKIASVNAADPTAAVNQVAKATLILTLEA